MTGVAHEPFRQTNPSSGRLDGNQAFLKRSKVTYTSIKRVYVPQLLLDSEVWSPGSAIGVIGCEAHGNAFQPPPNESLPQSHQNIDLFWRLQEKLRSWTQHKRKWS